MTLSFLLYPRSHNAVHSHICINVFQGMHGQEHGPYSTASGVHTPQQACSLRHKHRGRYAHRGGHTRRHTHVQTHRYTPTTHVHTQAIGSEFSLKPVRPAPSSERMDQRFTKRKITPKIGCSGSLAKLAPKKGGGRE